jgi:hypothetical protein
MLLLKQVPSHLQAARAGNFYHDPSAVPQEIARFAFEMLSQELQGAVGVAIHQYPGKLDSVLILKNKIQGFLHGRDASPRAS